MSILASDVAAETGVLALSLDTLEIATATGRVPAQPASIGRMQVGDLAIEHATAMIVSDALLQVRLGEGPGPGTSVKIDGVIGFDIISRLNLRIDYVNRTVTLMKPAGAVARPQERNLFWIGTPVVRVLTPKGVALHFNLDTGAEETYVTDALPGRAKVRTFSGERRLVGGFAGLEITHGRFIDELRVASAGQALVFRKLLIFAPDISAFVRLDGVLGSDVGRAGVVRIDATNGLFRLEPAPRRLRPPG
jgi:hypothetical protein